MTLSSMKLKRSSMDNYIVIYSVLLCLLLQPVNGQFGEIASIVTGLLGSGAGLGSLAGAGASAGAAGASGAAGALGGIGQLYNLAQAALQLTGTGVGIVNQASESAWFPAAVENAARMNRDFQDRLLSQQKNGGAGAGAGGLGAGGLGGGGLQGLLGGLAPKPGGAGGKDIDELGGEFGKEFGSHETEEEKPKPIEIKPVEDKDDKGNVPVKGQVSLLPGESLASSREEPEVEVPQKEGEKEKKEEDIPSPPIPAPRITVELPEDKEKINKPDVEFNVDSSEDSFPLIPPKASSPEDSGSSLIPASKNGETMVPELQNLISALHKSNLTSEELRELTKQLEVNKDLGEPRENTTPQPSDLKTAADRQPDTEIERQEIEAKKKAVNRNLLALRKALEKRPELRSALGDPKVIRLPTHPHQHEAVRHMVDNGKEVEMDNTRVFAAPLLAQPPRRYITASAPSQASAKSVAKGARNRANVRPNPLPQQRPVQPQPPHQPPPVQPSQVQPVHHQPPPQYTTPAPPSTQTYAQYQQAYQQYYNQYYGNQQQQQAQYQHPWAHQNPYYNPHYYQHVAQQFPQPQNPTHYQYQYQAQQQPNVVDNRQYPARTVGPSVVTPSPAMLQHPWSQGQLLTIPQPVN